MRGGARRARGAGGRGAETAGRGGGTEPAAAGARSLPRADVGERGGAAWRRRARRGHRHEMLRGGRLGTAAAELVARRAGPTWLTLCCEGARGAREAAA